MEYNEFKTRITNKSCILLTTEDEFINNKFNTKSKLNVKMKCGHDEEISLNLFQRRTYNVCKQCIYKIHKNNSYNEINQVNTSALTEAKSFAYIKSLIDKHFEVIKTYESCRADMIIKPINNNKNEWLGIQLKSCLHIEDKIQYSFRKIGIYKNMLIICIAMPENKIWIFEGEELYGKNSISIGKNIQQISKYNKNEITKYNIIQYLLLKYEKYPKFTLELFNIPVSKNQQIEHENRMCREFIMKNYFDLKYPTMDGTKYDIIINNHKVQDKSARKTKNANSYYATLVCHNDNYYKKGDNDFY